MGKLSPIPGVKDKDLARVAAQLVLTPDVKAAASDRFLGQVQAIMERRAQSKWPNEGASNFCVFVKLPYPRRAQKICQTERVADLIATKDPVLDKIFFLNNDASQGLAAVVPAQKPGDVLDWLHANGLGEHVVLLVYRDDLLLIERANGALKEVTRTIKLRDQLPLIEQAELLRGLEKFHEEVLTPTVCPEGVWSKASKYYPGQQPERAIQNKLRTFLNAWFKGLVRAECEDTTPIGRIDVRLLVQGDSQLGLAYWAVIELKVTRSYRFSAAPPPPDSVPHTENAEAIAEGLRQSYAFCSNRKCPPGFLEIFDMRKNKSDNVLQHETVATQLKAITPPTPVVNVRPLFGKAGDARKAGYTL